MDDIPQTFLEWSRTEGVYAPIPGRNSGRIAGLTSDKALLIDLGAYTMYLRRNVAWFVQLKDFLALRMALTARTPVVATSRPSPGAVEDSRAHVRHFFESCRYRAGGRQFPDTTFPIWEPGGVKDFDKIDFYRRMSSRDRKSNIPLWIRYSFTRSVGYHTEHVWLQFNGQPDRVTESLRGPHIDRDRLILEVARAYVYLLMDIAERHDWKPNMNPIPELLSPLLPRLRLLIAMQEALNNNNWKQWINSTKLSVDLMMSNMESRPRDLQARIYRRVNPVILGQNALLEELAVTLLDHAVSWYQKYLIIGRQSADKYLEPQKAARLAAELAARVAKKEALIDAFQHKVSVDKIPAEDRMCSICRTDYTKLYLDTGKTDQPVRVPCKHIFGLKCITMWLKTCALCPLCRRNYKVQIKEIKDFKVEL